MNTDKEIEKITEILKTKQSWKKQHSYSRIANYLNYCKEFDLEIYVEPIKSCIDLLNVKKPNYKYINCLLDSYGPLVNKRNQFRENLLKNSPLTNSLVGIGLSTYLALVLETLIVVVSGSTTIFGIDTYLLLGCMIMGSFGGSASIISRMLKLDTTKELDSSIVVYTGILKPLLGMVYGLLALMAFKSKIINLSSVLDNNFFYYLMSLLAGLSESFVNDIISRVSKKSV